MTPEERKIVADFLFNMCNQREKLSYQKIIELAYPNISDEHKQVIAQRIQHVLRNITTG